MSQSPQSPEAVALALYERVLNAEGRENLSRKKILNLYAECLEATLGRRDFEEA